MKIFQEIYQSRNSNFPNLNFSIMDNISPFGFGYFNLIPRLLLASK